MTHKDFLTEVQHRCALDRQVCSALMQSAIKLMAEQATEQIAVEWEGIGHFIATKHPEYVAEDPESGLQTMYPPRISYRLSQQEPASQSVKELNATQFAFHLARYAKATEGDAEFFMHVVCKLILERLDANDPVEIQGLGVFSWVESQQGRRMSLQVDEKMRALVNAPFACFEPMTLAVEAKRVETSVQEDVVDSAPEPEVETATEEVLEAEHEPVPEPEQDVEPVAVTLSEPEPEINVEPESQVEPELQPETIAVPVSAIEQEPCSEPTLMDRLQPWIDQLKSLPKSWLYGGVAGVALLLLLVVWLLLPSKKEEPQVAAVQSEEYKIQRGSEDEVEAEEESVSSAEQETPSIDQEPSKPQETLPVAKVPEPKPAAPAPKPASKPTGGKPTNDMLLLENGQPKMDQLGEGGRLTLVALRHYGDKAFWAYIYDVNAFQLGDPNNVPVGLPLYLPDPTYFKIDASDPASIRRAQNRAMQILNQKK